MARRRHSLIRVARLSSGVGSTFNDMCRTWQSIFAGRGFNAEWLNRPNYCDPAHLYGVDADCKTESELIQWAKRAIDDGAWLILCGHEVGASAHQTFDADVLAAIGDFARRNDVWIDTVAAVVEHVRSVRSL